jgi:hypothetical protein
MHTGLRNPRDDDRMHACSDAAMGTSSCRDWDGSHGLLLNINSIDDSMYIQ